MRRSLFVHTWLTPRVSHEITVTGSLSIYTSRLSVAFFYVQIHLAPGSIKTLWYCKPSSKNILVNYHCTHPCSAKKGIIRNMFRTARSVPSDDAQKSFHTNWTHSGHIAIQCEIGTLGTQDRRPRCQGQEREKCPLPWSCPADEVSA